MIHLETILGAVIASVTGFGVGYGCGVLRRSPERPQDLSSPPSHPETRPKAGSPFYDPDSLRRDRP